MNDKIIKISEGGTICLPDCICPTEDETGKEVALTVTENNQLIIEKL